MKSAEIVRFLKDKVELFQHFDDTELSALIESSRVVDFAPQEFIIEFGEKAKFLGVLLQGEAEISITQDNGERKVLTQVRPGDPFGEEAMMTGEPSIADCICSQSAQALLIPQDLFSSKIIANPQALLHLSKVLVTHLKQVTDGNGTEKIKASALVRSNDPYGFDLQTEDPMKLLIINCGSSSLKFYLIDTMNQDNQAKGSIERIGLDDTKLSYASSRGSDTRPVSLGNHDTAFAAMLEILQDETMGGIGRLDEITAVAHRGTLGGEKHRGAVLVTEERPFRSIRHFERYARNRGGCRRWQLSGHPRH